MTMRFSTKLRYNWFGHAASGTPSTGNTLLDLLNANPGGAAGFWIAIFSGTQPANPEASKGTAVLLATIKGPAGIGCLLDNASTTTGDISKTSAVWSCTAEAAGGIAGWFRLYMRDNTATYGDAITTAGVGETVANYAFRIDGTCGTSSAFDLILPTTTILPSQSVTVDVFTIKLPYAA